MTGRIFALFLLGTALLRTLVLRLLPRRPALPGFDERYGGEGILAVTPEEHELLIAAGRCIACGRCSDPDAPRGSPEARIFEIVVGGFRALPDARFTALELAQIDEDTLVRAERRCPVDVPIARLAAFTRGHAERQAISLSRASGRRRLFRA